MRQIALPRGESGAKSRCSASSGVAQLGGAGSQQARGAFSASRAGVDAVDRNPVAAQLHRQSLRHMYHGTIARPTAEIAGVAGVGAADVDDAAPTLLFQVGNDGAGAAQRPTYFTLKSCSKSSSTTVSMGPVAVAEPLAGNRCSPECAARLIAVLPGRPCYPPAPCW